MKKIILFGAGFVSALLVVKHIASKQDTIDYVDLENIRKGIANNWYKADYIWTTERPGFPQSYSVHLIGVDTTGAKSEGWYPITEATFNALKADGIPVNEMA